MDLDMLYSFQKDFGLASWVLLPPLAHPEVPLNVRRQNYTTFAFSHISVSACRLKYVSGFCEPCTGCSNTSAASGAAYTHASA